MANIIKIGYYYTPVEFPNLSLFGRNQYIGEVSYDVKQSFPDINKDVRQLAEAKILISDSIPLRREDFPKNRDDFLVSLVNFDEFSKILFNKQKKIKKIDPNYDKQLERYIKNNRIIKSNLIMYIKEIFKPLTELEITTNQNVKNNQIYTIVNDWNFLFKPYDSSSDFNYLESIMYDYNLNKPLIKGEQNRKKIRDVVSYVTKRKEHAFLSYYVEYIEKNVNNMAFYIDDKALFTKSTPKTEEKKKEKGEVDDDDDEDDDDKEEGIAEDIENYNKMFRRIISYLRRKQGMTFPNVNPNEDADTIQNALKMYEYAKKKEEEEEKKKKEEEKKNKEENKEEENEEKEEKEELDEEKNDDTSDNDNLKEQIKFYTEKSDGISKSFSKFIFDIEPSLQDYRRLKSTRGGVYPGEGQINNRDRIVRRIMKILIEEWHTYYENYKDRMDSYERALEEYRSNLKKYNTDLTKIKEPEKPENKFYDDDHYKEEYNNFKNRLTKVIEPLMHWISTTEYEDFKQTYELNKNRGDNKQSVYSINIYKNPNLLREKFKDLNPLKGDENFFSNLQDPKEDNIKEWVPGFEGEYKDQYKYMDEKNITQNLFRTIKNIYNRNYILKERNKKLFEDIKSDQEITDETKTKYNQTNDDTTKIFQYVDNLLLELQEAGILKYHGSIHMDYNNEPILYEKKNGNKYEVIKYGDLWDLLKIEKKQSSADERKRRDMMYRNHSGILDDRARRSYYSSDIADNLETYQITLEKAFALKLDYRDTKEIEIAYQNNKCQVKQVSDLEHSLKNVRTAWSNRTRKISDLIKKGMFTDSNTPRQRARERPVTKKKIDITVKTLGRPMNRRTKKTDIHLTRKNPERQNSRLVKYPGAVIEGLGQGLGQVVIGLPVKGMETAAKGMRAAKGMGAAAAKGMGAAAARGARRMVGKGLKPRTRRLRKKS